MPICTCFMCRIKSIRVSQDNKGIDITWLAKQKPGKTYLASGLKMAIQEDLVNSIQEVNSGPVTRRCDSCGTWYGEEFLDYHFSKYYCQSCLWIIHYASIGPRAYPIVNLPYDEARKCYIETGKELAFARMLEEVTLSNPPMSEPAEAVNKAVFEYNLVAEKRNDYLIIAKVTAGLAIGVTALTAIIVMVTRSPYPLGTEIAALYAAISSIVFRKKRRQLKNESIRLRAAIPADSR